MGTVALPAPAGPTTKELESLVTDTVYYLIISDQHKEGIKKKDIQKHALKNNGRVMRTVMPLAKKKLEDVFGYTLVDLGDKHGSVILVSKLDISGCQSIFNRSEKDLAKEGFTLLVLTLIFMSSGTVPSDKLWKMLKPFGINPEALDPTFGDVTKLIDTELVRQHYLESSVISGTDPPSTVYSWGMRAKMEVSKRKVLEMVCQVLGTGTKPEQWVTLYDDVVRSEQATQGN